MNSSRTGDEPDTRCSNQQFLHGTATDSAPTSTYPIMQGNDTLPVVANSTSNEAVFQKRKEGQNQNQSDLLISNGSETDTQKQQNNNGHVKTMSDKSYCKRKATGSNHEKYSNQRGDMVSNCLHTLDLSQSNQLPVGKRSTKPKRDRSHLRKGKWTPEEEEYTSRIIQYFRSGLLTLPDGITLRSYIAQKLDCDPMRITKKFAGASCVGKRVYHLHQRTQYAIQDIEMAKAELSKLERRFKSRVEEGHCGQSLSPTSAESILHSANQANMNMNSLNLAAFPFLNPPATNNNAIGLIDSSWLTKDASTLGASAITAPGLSALFVQQLANQQLQKSQQEFSQCANDASQQPQFQQFIQQYAQQLCQQLCQQQQQQQQQQQNPNQQQPNQHAESSDSTLQQLQQQQSSSNVLPWMSLQSQMKPMLLSQFLLNQQINPSFIPQAKISVSQGNNNIQSYPQTNVSQNKYQDFNNVEPKQYQSAPSAPESIPSSIESPIQDARFFHTSSKAKHQQQQTQPQQQLQQQPMIGNTRRQQETTLSPSKKGQKRKSPSSDPKHIGNHSKEDVDAGNTLLVFLKELRKNHDDAMSSMSGTPTETSVKGQPISNGHQTNGSCENGTHCTVSTSGLISETSQIHKVINPKNDLSDAISSISGDTRCASMNKDESIKSESSSDSAAPDNGSGDASSEDDQRDYRTIGPIRKRFRYDAFTSQNVQRHNNRANNNKKS